MTQETQTLTEAWNNQRGQSERAAWLAFKDEVASTAASLKEEQRDEELSEDDLQERLHETIDGHELVIYYWGHEMTRQAMNFSGNGWESLDSDYGIEEGTENADMVRTYAHLYAAVSEALQGVA